MAAAPPPAPPGTLPRPAAAAPPPPTLPPSASSFAVNCLGLAALFASYYFLRGSAASLQTKVVLVLTCVAVPIGLIDIFVFRVHRRPSTGLDWDKPSDADPVRVATKVLGFGVTVAAIAFAYWLFPEYHGSFYDPFYRLLQRFALPILLVLPVYFTLIDGAMREPHDAYWQIGRFFLGRFGDARGKDVANHARGWLVKAFFLPLMTVYAHDDIARILGFHYETLHWGDFALYDLCYTIGYSIDLVFVTFGYMLSFRLFDSHLRSAEPTMLGWAVALFCYQPFFGLMDRVYVAYDAGKGFASWLEPWPVVKGVWAVVILVLVGLYSLSSVAFGWRFSNLTHRGILTGGTYRFTKHPAYVSKNISWWMISLPFLSQDGIADGVRRSILLLCINIMYFLRARTEERHLSRDPVYVEYALWMNDHGLLRGLGRLIPAFKYRPPAS
jgi:protein-S-isoprenylcysteine O-methyltransferase Ste14